jgi:hypothetical protein
MTKPPVPIQREKKAMVPGWLNRQVRQSGYGKNREKMANEDHV